MEWRRGVVKEEKAEREKKAFLERRKEGEKEKMKRRKRGKEEREKKKDKMLEKIDLGVEGKEVKGKGLQRFKKK